MTTKYFLNHKELGLCTRCNKRAVKGEVSCRYHLNLNKKNARVRAKRFKTKKQTWKNDVYFAG